MRRSTVATVVVSKFVVIFRSPKNCSENQDLESSIMIPESLRSHASAFLTQVASTTTISLSAHTACLTSKVNRFLGRGYEKLGLHCLLVILIEQCTSSSFLKRLLHTFCCLCGCLKVRQRLRSHDGSACGCSTPPFGSLTWNQPILSLTSSSGIRLIPPHEKNQFFRIKVNLPCPFCCPGQRTEKQLKNPRGRVCLLPLDPRIPFSSDLGCPMSVDQ